MANQQNIIGFFFESFSYYSANLFTSNYKWLGTLGNLVDHLIILLVPITNKKVELILGLRKWHIDDNAIVDSNWAKSSRSPLKIGCGEVKEAPNLILHLKNVSPIVSWLDWAVGPGNPILP